MRAAIYDRSAPEGIRVAANWPRPATVPQNHVLIRVCAAGVNPVDAKRVIGDKLPAFMAGVGSRLVEGRVAGFDFAGVVEAVGPTTATGVEPMFVPGVEVFGIMPPLKGSFADVVLCPSDQLCAKPETLTMRQAAALPLVGLTAVQLFEQHHLRAGQRVLVIGATGGVGHVASQVAVTMGASVAGICSRSNFDLAKRHGCSVVFAYDDPKVSLVDALRRHCRAAGPFHLVVDTVTSNDERDARCHYPSLIMTVSEAEPQHILATPGTGEGGGGGAAEDGRVGASDSPGDGGAQWTVDRHNYVTIGSSTPLGWAKAGVKKLTGWNVFPEGRELFWITPKNSAHHLRRLKHLSEQPAQRTDGSEGGGERAHAPGICPLVGGVVPLTSEGLATAFKAMHSRHSKGKYVVDCSLPGAMASSDTASPTDGT